MSVQVFMVNVKQKMTSKKGETESFPVREREKREREAEDKRQDPDLNSAPHRWQLHRF
jgi:hypothetical protein